MSGFFRCFSDRFLKDGKIHVTEESKERQKNIDSLVEENVLTKSQDGKRYAIHKWDMCIYEIVDEKNGFIRIKDNDEKERWEEKDLFYCDNIVYNTTEDFIEKERDKLLSLIDTGRYDVYKPTCKSLWIGEITPEMIKKEEEENAEILLDFIKKHTTADFGSGRTIFSNYILIGF